MEMSQNYNYVPFNIQPGFNETTKLQQEDYLLQWILITFKPLIHFYQTEILYVQLFVLKNKRLPIPQRINCAVNYWLDWVGGRGGGGDITNNWMEGSSAKCLMIQLMVQLMVRVFWWLVLLIEWRQVRL